MMPTINFHCDFTITEKLHPDTVNKILQQAYDLKGMHVDNFHIIKPNFSGSFV